MSAVATVEAPTSRRPGRPSTGGSFSDLEQKIAALTAAVAALTAAQPAPRRTPDDLTFADVYRAYLPRAPRSFVPQMAPVLRHFGESKIKGLRRIDWFHYRDDVRALQPLRRGRGFPSVGTKNQELKHTLAMLRWAVLAEMVDANPFEGCKREKGGHVRETEIDPLELEAAMGDAPTILRLFLTACIETGMRNGSEVLRMEWTHIDWSASLIRIPKLNTKTREARVVPMSEHLAEALSAWPHTVGNPFVFASPYSTKKGQHYSYQHMHKLARTVLDKLQAAPGDGRVRTHDARHSVVSRLARGGVSLFAAMKIVGHKSSSMHWRYSHVSEGDRQKARAVLAADRKAPGESAEGRAA